jgi:hypothetical protein
MTETKDVITKPAPKPAEPADPEAAAAEAAAKSAEETAKVHEADRAQQQADAVAGLPVVPADHVTVGYVPEPDVEEGSRSASAPAVEPEKEPAKK